jgi:hypothetical protein
MRLAGFVTGCLLVLAAFLLVLPERGATPPPAMAERSVDPPVLPAKDAQVPAETAPVAGIDTPAVLPPAAVTPGERETPSAAADPPGPVSEPVPEPASGTATVPAAPGFTAGEPPPGESSQGLWSPFRSHWAAEGFAQRLVTATDAPVEVEEAGPGEYRVVLRYRDERERQAMIAHIEAITGLELE